MGSEDITAIFYPIRRDKETGLYATATCWHLRAQRAGPTIAPLLASIRFLPLSVKESRFLSNPNASTTNHKKNQIQLLVTLICSLAFWLVGNRGKQEETQIRVLVLETSGCHPAEPCPVGLILPCVLTHLKLSLQAEHFHLKCSLNDRQ